MNKLKEKLTASVISAYLSGTILLVLLAQLLNGAPVQPQTVVNKLGGIDLYRIASSSAITVTTTSGLLRATTSGSGYAAIVNDGANVVYLNFGDRPAVLYSGLRLNANGGTFEINDENLYKGAIRAITASGNSTTTYFEAF